MADKYKCDPADRARALKRLRQVIKTKDEQEFMMILRELGIKDEDPACSRALKLFRDGKF
jgi:hypothetical protein